MSEEAIQTNSAQEPGQQQDPPAKTFTQEDVDAIVARRVAKATKGMPDEAELTAFRTWKASQQTEQERMNAVTQERDKAKVDLAAALAMVEQYEHEKYMLGKGVPAEDVDYYVFKAEQLVSDNKTFEQAAEEFINSKKPQNNSKVVVNLGGSLQGGGGQESSSDMMNALIRGARN